MISSCCHYVVTYNSNLLNACGQHVCMCRNTQAMDNKANCHRFPNKVDSRTLQMDMFHVYSIQKKISNSAAEFTQDMFLGEIQRKY